MRFLYLLLFLSVFFVQAKSPLVLEQVDIKYTALSFEGIKVQQNKFFFQDLGQLSAHFPGVVMETDAGSGLGYISLRVRGQNQRRLQVFYHGFLLNDAESQSVYFVNMPDITAGLSGLYLQKTPAPVAGYQGFGWGNALFLEPSVAEDFSLYSRHFYGSFQTIKNSIALHTGNLGKWSGFFRISQVDSEGYREYTPLRQLGYEAHLKHRSSQHQSELIFFGGFQKTGAAWDGLSEGQMKKNRRYNPSAYYIDKAGNTLLFKDASDNYQQQHLQFHQQFFAHPQVKWGYRLNYTYGAGFVHSMKQRKLVALGLEAEKDKKEVVQLQKWLQNHAPKMHGFFQYSSKNWQQQVVLGNDFYIGKHFGNIMASIENYPLALPLEYYKRNSFLNTFFARSMTHYLLKECDFYLALEYQNHHYSTQGFLDDLTKGKYIFKQNNHFVTPIVGFDYRFDKDQNIYVHYGFFEQRPFGKDFETAVVEKKPLPKPEYKHHLELGYRFSKPYLYLQAQFFGSYFTDQLVLTGAVDENNSTIRKNIGKSYQLGTELSFQLPIFSFWKMGADLTYMHSVNLDYAFFEDKIWKRKNTKTSYTPDFIGNLEQIFSFFKSWEIVFSAHYVDRIFLNNENTHALKGYAWLDFKTNYTLPFKKVFKNILFFVHLNNLTDHLYSTYAVVDQNEVYFFPQAGFQFYGGLQFQF